MTTSDLGWINKIKEYGISGGLVLAILFIIVALGLNIRAASWISFANKYGTRGRSECGNEYLEYVAPNYQIYELIKGDPGDKYHGKEASKIMTNAFILVQVSWIILITGLFILVTTDLYDVIPTGLGKIAKFKDPAVILLVVSVAGYISYLSTYSLYINKLVSGMKNADLAQSGVPKVSNMTRLYSLYLPTLAAIIPILYIIYYQARPFNSSYYIYAILYVIIISIAIQFNSTSLNVISTVNTTYWAITEDLQNKINNILILSNGNPTAAPNRPATNAQDQLKIDLIQNIKSVETTDGDNFILNDYKDVLWKYLLHQNGNELQDLLTNYASDPNIGAITDAVKQIRVDMRNLRTDTSLQKAASSFTTSTLQFAIIIFFVIFYAIFHFIYKHLARPIHASVGIASIVLLLVIIGPLYGWLQAVIN